MMNECCKFTVCVFSLFAQQQFSVRKSIRAFKEEIIGKPFETIKLIVPSGLYCLQNNLLFVALTNLDAATYQVSNSDNLIHFARLFMIFFLSILGHLSAKNSYHSIVLRGTAQKTHQVRSVAGITYSDNWCGSRIRK